MANEAMLPEPPGLGEEYPSDYPSQITINDRGSVIDRLRPDSDEHHRVLTYLNKRIEESERVMQQFYPRWLENEIKLHAHIYLPDYEAKVKQKNRKGEPPQQVSIIIPTTQATIATIATYLTHTFTGRRPIHQVGSYRDEHMENAANMETVLQYNHDHSRSIRYFAQGMWDWQVYGFSAWRIGWEEQHRMRTRRKQRTQFTSLGEEVPGETEVTRELAKIYEGNVVLSIDPYGYLPDPRVPLSEAPNTGEYIFWRSWEGKHSLLKDEFDGHLKWVKQTKPYSKSSQYSDPASLRNEIYGGRSFPGRDQPSMLRDNYRVDEGTIWVIPRELGLGDSERPEMWLFTILNGNQIVQAERFDSDHGMHPVVVTEPMIQSYGLGNPGTVDFIGALQDAISWLFNSHQTNVTKVINNDLVVSPDLIVMKDLKPAERQITRVIRLKRTAIGQDVKNAIQQLPVQDVTRGHVNDIQVLLSIVERISGASDNLQGVQDEGGRKTATEIRTAASASVNRLAYLTRLISAHAMVPMAEQMAMNNQQYLSDPFYLLITGQQGIQAPIRMTPDMLGGDFHFPIHDGTLPVDRVALLDVWKEMLALLLKVPPLAQGYDLRKIFERTAELGGIRNIEAMRIQPMSPQGIAQGQSNGSLVPITPELIAGLGTGSNPAVGGVM